MLEEEMMWVCPKCGNIKAGWTDDLCSQCGSHIIITDITADDDIFNMTQLQRQQWRKEIQVKYVKSSPIFDEKAQDKRLTEELKESYEAKHQIKCPTCQSTNVSPIGFGERAVSISMLGIFSKKINKSFKCSHCGMTW